MVRRLYPKPYWAKAIGASLKPKRLKLVQKNGLYFCPVSNCDSEGYKTKRGCRKHVFYRHGWYYYFAEKPEMIEVFPEICSQRVAIQRPRRSRTSSMPMFKACCNLAVSFKKWLISPGGSGKGDVQANQIVTRVLKFAKFCCDDVSSDWQIPEPVIDYCIGSVTLMSEFVEYLQTQWKVGHSGVIGYMTAIGHILDYRRSSGLNQLNMPVFVASVLIAGRPWNDVTESASISKDES